MMFSRKPDPSPLSQAMTAKTITVRVVRSFEYKTVRNLYFHDLDLENTTLEQLKAMCDESIWSCKTSPSIFVGIQTTDNLKFMAAIPFDTFKIYSQPYGAKTSNPVINLIDDESLILKDWSKPLTSLGFRNTLLSFSLFILYFVENETEVSLFVLAEYLNYKENPVFKW